MHSEGGHPIRSVSRTGEIGSQLGALHSLAHTARPCAPCSVQDFFFLLAGGAQRIPCPCPRWHNREQWLRTDMSQENLLSIYTAPLTFGCCYIALGAAQTDPKTPWGLLLKGARVRYFFGGGVVTCAWAEPCQNGAHRLISFFFFFSAQIATSGVKASA